MQYSAFNFLKLIVFFSRLFRYYNKVCFGVLVQVWSIIAIRSEMFFPFQIRD